MSGRAPSAQQNNNKQITIVLVDDIPEMRENIKKLLAFEPDFEVIGTAGTGREGVQMAKEHQPDVIIMDINMPDMDGLQATDLISKSVPMTAVIIMSVQNDADYMRRAMLAGARDFLSKPVNMDELYNTIRTVYQNHEAVRQQYASMPVGPTPTTRPKPGADSTTRAGNVIAVYSPQGGAGVTTIATSLASGLMKEGIKVLLIDADLQFADVSAFLNLQAQSTIVELAPDVDDMDVELFENIVVTHESGLKVLAGPQRPEMAEEVASKPNTVAQIISKVAPNYDFVIVDTATSINEVLLGIFDQATKIILVTTPYFVNVKNMRMVLDLFDQLGYDADKAKLVLNHVWEDRKGKSATIAPERVQSYLKRDIIGRVPHVDERMLLSAINKGVPVIASDRDQNKPPIKQLVDLSNLVYTMLMGEEEEDVLSEEESKKRNFSLFGR